MSDIFDEDLCLCIALFLDVVSLERVMGVNQMWRRVALTNAIWERLCAVLWAGKPAYCSNKIFKFVRLTPSTMKTLRVPELKHLAQTRGISVKGFAERTEFEEQLVRFDDQLTPRFLPGLIPLNGKWRASYIQSLRDMERARMTLEELCAQEWHFVFLQHLGQHSSTARFTTKFRFHMDPWPMQDPGPEGMTFRFAQDNLAVGIEQFPVHALARLPTSKTWMMSNQYVAFFQKTETLDRDLQEFVDVVMPSWGMSPSHDDDSEED